MSWAVSCTNVNTSVQYSQQTPFTWLDDNPTIVTVQCSRESPCTISDLSWNMSTSAYSVRMRADVSGVMAPWSDIVPVSRTLLFLSVLCCFD